MSAIVVLWLLAGVSLIPALRRLTRLVRRARKLRARFVRCLPAIRESQAKLADHRQWSVTEW